jgi:hypothetical protein
MEELEMVVQNTKIATALALMAFMLPFLRKLGQ